MENIIKDIETRYPVDTITANGEQVWPYLRVHCFFNYWARLSAAEGERQSYAAPAPSGKLRLGLKLAASSLYGASTWLGKYDYVALSSTNARRLIDGKHFNVFLDHIIDELGGDRVLLIESAPPLPRHHPLRQVHTQNVASSDGLVLGQWIARKGMREPAVENASVLKTIQRQYGLEIPHAHLIQGFEAARRLYTRVLRRLQPRGVLLTCYYGLEPAVKAAHDLGIEVIEVQHGVIGKEHFAYNVHTDLDRSCFPDHLLVLGQKELETFDNARFIDPGHVHPVGSFYIDYIKSTFRPDPGLVARLQSYRHAVGVTLELGAEKRMMNFISRAASLDNSIFYMVIPRVHDDYLRRFILPDNAVISTDHNFYQSMMYVDFHSAICSTCALEAPSLGVQNILIDIDGHSSRYYADVLTDSRITRYVDTPEEYVDTIRTFPKVDRETVCRLNDHIIATGYRQNIRSFVRDHLR